MTQKGIPGPLPTSCLTCKQRHKKCDMRQPTCLRCEEGDFECLGYSHIERDTTTSTQASVPGRRLKPRRILPKAQASNHTPLAQYTGGPESVWAASSTSTGPGHSDPGTLVQQSDPTTQDYLRLFSPKPYETQTSPKPPSLDSIFLSCPSDPTLGYLNGPEFEVYVVSYFFRRIMEVSYFKPTKDQCEEACKLVVLRLRGSQYYRWLTLLTKKICEAISDWDRSQSELHLRWIGDIETVIWGKLNQGLSPHEADGLRGEWFEVLLLKTALVGTSGAYALLRAATPMFLQIAYALPDLWTTTSDPAFIPLLNIISSEDHKLASFTLMDSVCAMIFGLPQQVEYDTSTGQVPMSLHPHEWANSSPIEFQVVLAEINACRDQSPGARNWREIEDALVHWKSRIVQHDESWESWMLVSWLAVQESWRLALLAYLYLAVCRCPSDDPRIQQCITQILQVIGTVKKHESPHDGVQFLIQYLMVGICARSEKHRKIVRDTLLDVNRTRFWMMRGAEVVPVLDYLWHSAGSDGRPITWDDYIYSRVALLPIMP